MSKRAKSSSSSSITTTTPVENIAVSWDQIPDILRTTDPLLTPMLMAWKLDHAGMGHYWNRLMKWISDHANLMNQSISRDIQVDPSPVLDLTPPFLYLTQEIEKLIVLPPLPSSCVNVDARFNRIIDLHPHNGHLRCLDLSHNNLQVLACVPMSVMERVSLSHTKIQAIPYNLTLSTKLQILDVTKTEAHVMPVLGNSNAFIKYKNTPLYRTHLDLFQVKTIDPLWCYSDICDHIHNCYDHVVPGSLADAVPRKLANARHDILMGRIENQHEMIQGLILDLKSMHAAIENTRIICDTVVIRQNLILEGMADMPRSTSNINNDNNNSGDGGGMERSVYSSPVLVQSKGKKRILVEEEDNTDHMHKKHHFISLPDDETASDDTGSSISDPSTVEQYNTMTHGDDLLGLEFVLSC